MNQVIVFPRGQLPPGDKARMSKSGIIAVEADDPSKVVQLVPGASLVTGDDLLMSALAGITSSSSYSQAGNMVSDLHERLKARENKK